MSDFEFKGLEEEVVKQISKVKHEPDWMLEFRLKSYHAFLQKEQPHFGPVLDIHFDSITYFKRILNQVSTNWKDVPVDIRKTFQDIGIQAAEANYLGGVSTQCESEVIYHNMLSYLEEKGVLFVDTDTALKKYPDLFQSYFNTLVQYDENKYTALNGAVWSGGSFIYVPKGVKLDRPLQSYFRIHSKEMGQFERTLIIVDDDAELSYIEGCTAIEHNEEALHAAVVEIFVGKNARCRYTTIQNWSKNIFNLVTKRSVVKENGLMEWIDGNIGSSVTMKYPSCILDGVGAKGYCVTIALADSNQVLDTGAKMIHLAPYTKSTILSKSIARGGGNATYRGLVKIAKQADHSFSSIRCDTILLDSKSKSDTIVEDSNHNPTSTIEHEASVSTIGEKQLFYLMSRGISEEKAKELIIMGFTNEFREELPMEYAVELNHLLKNEI